jgi:hypothetical protein
MTVTVATTPDQLDAIAASWDQIPIASPHASRSLFTVVQRVSDGTSRPHVMLIENDGRPPILVVARVERRPLHVKAGYRVLFTAPARWLVVVAGGVVGAETPADYRQVTELLRATLRTGEVDILQLSKVEVDGPLHRAALQDVPGYRRDHGSTPVKHHRSDLSAGVDAFLAARSKGTRWRLRRRLRKLDDAPPKMVVRRIGPDDSVDDATRTLDSIAARSYQRGIGVGFADDELHRAFMASAIEGGPFRAWVLSVDGNPVAFLDGLLHERTFHLFETAFDGALADDEPGAILMARVLAELAEEPDVDAFDYGFGDAQYKQSLSDASWDEVDVLEFAARPRALCLNAVTVAATYGVTTAKRVLGPDRVAALRRRRRAKLMSAGAADTDGE